MDESTFNAAKDAVANEAGQMTKERRDWVLSVLEKVAQDERASGTARVVAAQLSLELLQAEVGSHPTGWVEFGPSFETVTRDGRPAVVKSYDLRERQPFYGKIFEADKRGWSPATWDKNGNAVSSKYPDGMDLEALPDLEDFDL